jgi:HK97 family phage prohead protease
MPNKTFILSDESINTHGFRVLTAGIQLDSFRRNPIMLWNHSSAWRGTKEEILPVGRWDNIRVEGGKLLADAVLDDGDNFAKEIARKVEKGIINMCSIGFAVIEQSEDKSVILPGQRYATVTKCRLREVSLVDMGANLNSVVLYDEAGKIIELSESGDALPLSKLKDTNFILNDMKIIALKLGLTESATQDEILAAITKLQDDNKEVVSLRDKIAATEKERKEARAAEAATLIDAALKSGKIDAKAKEDLQKLFEADFDSAKKTLQSLPERATLRSQIAGGNTGGSANGEFAGKWDELDRQGKLASLKENDSELFKAKFKEKFGTEPAL